MSAFKEIFAIPVCSTGHAAAQLVEVGATNQKVASSIPDLVTEFFIDIILPAALKIASASDKN
jgi:hypothetical protein